MFKNLFAARPYNPDAADFCLFGCYGDAQTMRNICLRIAMGDFSDLNLYVVSPDGKHVPWTPGTTVNAGEILELRTAHLRPGSLPYPDAEDVEYDWHILLTHGKSSWTMANDWAWRDCTHGILPLSANELAYADGLRVNGPTSSIYEKNTVPEIEKMRRHYAKRYYRLQNLRYEPSELQALCVNIALGKLPHEFMCYYDGNERYAVTSFVPKNPAEGAQILAKPLDRVIAEYHEGTWYLFPTTDLVKNEVAIDANILMYIGHKPVCTVRKTNP